MDALHVDSIINMVCALWKNEFKTILHSSTKAELQRTAHLLVYLIDFGSLGIISDITVTLYFPCS